MSDVFHIDFETYCEYNIKEVSRVKYVNHPSFEVLMFSYALNEGEVKLWERNQPLPEVFIQNILNSNVQIAAWNASFEWSVLHRFWREQFSEDLNLPLKRMLDVQAVAARYNYPVKLGVTGKIFKCPKIGEGLELIKLFCGPQKEGHRVYPKDAPQAWESFGEYCVQDTVAERTILQKLPRQSLSSFENKVWRHTVVQNNRGVRVDLDLVNRIVERLEEWKTYNVDKLKEITGGEITTGHQLQRMKNLAADYGIELPDMQADTIAPIIQDPAMPKVVRQVLKIRQNLGKISTKKYYRIQQAHLDGYVYDNLIYAGAVTDRFFHVGLQLGNLPARTGFKDVIPDYNYTTPEECIEDCIRAFNEGIESVKQLSPNVMALASVMIRPCLIPPDGDEWMVGDYSSVEFVILHWLAHDWDTLAEFKQGLDQYVTFAATLYNLHYDQITKAQRQHGKTAILGLGFMMGAGPYVHTAAGYGIHLTDQEADRTVQVYRNKFHKVKKMWYATYSAAMEAVLNPGRVTVYKYIKFVVQEGYLHMRLPTGKSIRYKSPFVKEKMMPWGKYKPMIHFHGTIPNTQGRGWGAIELTPGRLIENAVQGLGREILVRGMINTEKAGYKSRFSVHDEGASTVKKGQGSIEEFSELMCDMGKWAEHLPLRVESYKADRYRK